MRRSWESMRRRFTTVVPANPWHHAVHDDRAGARDRGPAQPVLSVPLGDDVVSRLLQRRLQGVAEGGAVVDDQHRPLLDRLRFLASLDELAGAGEQLRAVIGLAEVLVGPGGQAADAVAHLGLRGEQDHRDCRGGGGRAEFLGE